MPHAALVRRPLVTAALIALLAGCGGSGETAEATLVRVVDGDTVRVLTNGTEEKVRLIGLDTPETTAGPECGGEEATRALQQLIADGDPVELVADPSQGDRDRYGRLLRYLQTPDGTDLGRAQILAGWAEVVEFDGRFDRVDDYRDAERAARANAAGVASLCG